MKKSILGVVVGAAVYFGWGAISWMVLPWHNSTFHRLPEEQLIMDTLKTVVTEPGMYCFPSNKNAEGQLIQTEWAEKLKKGPHGVLFFDPKGMDNPMPPQKFVIDILSCVGIAFLTMILLNLSRDRVKSIVPRAFLVASIGAVISLAAHVTYWNWFSFPDDMTKIAILDSLIGFLLLGFAQAKFVCEE